MDMYRLKLEYSNGMDALAFKTISEAECYLEMEITIPGVPYSIANIDTGEIISSGETEWNDPDETKII